MGSSGFSVSRPPEVIQTSAIDCGPAALAALGVTRMKKQTNLKAGAARSWR
jgi:hypothetical protein